MSPVLSSRPTNREFSFEFFPPKTAAGERQLARTAAQLGALGPSYVSVTFGSGVGCIVVLLILLSLLAYEYYSRLEFVNKQTSTPEIATITGFGFASGWRRNPGFTVVVNAQDSQGIAGSGYTRSDGFINCKIGDRIRAYRRGTWLYLDRSPCPQDLSKVSMSSSGKPPQ